MAPAAFKIEAFWTGARPGDNPAEHHDIHRKFDDFRERYTRDGGKDLFDGFTCTTFPYQSASSPPTCPESCTICTQQFVPEGARRNPVSFKRVAMDSDQVAASTVRELIETTQADYHYIRDKINTNGNAIVKRWQKKSPAKREHVLHTAVPDLPAKRHADVELSFEDANFIIDQFNGRWTKEKFDRQHNMPQDPRMVPFLNAETLCENPMRLLALMHHRAHAHPSEWIQFDREMIQGYFDGGMLRPTYNPHCVLMHGQEFGRLVPWYKDAAHRWETCGYPLALHLLRVQSKISTLLRKTVSELLNSSGEEASKGRDLWDKLVSISFRSEDCFVAESAYYSPLFAPPPKFDLDRITKKLKIRCDAALDEALLTQADPLYLHRLLRHKNSTYYKVWNNEDKQQMLFLTSVKGMMDHNRWSLVLDAAKDFADYSIKEDNGRMQLPKQYEEKLLSLEVVLRAHLQSMINDLGNSVASSRSFSHYFQDGRQITGQEVVYRSDPLFWALIELVLRNEQVNRPASWCFDFIDEHLANASPKENARIDQVLYDDLSDIALADEILTAIKSHKSYSPLPKDFDKVHAIYKETHGRTLSNYTTLLLSECDQDSTILDALIDFSQSMPPKKSSNTEKLAHNTELNKKFTRYWKMVRAKCLFSPLIAKLNPHLKIAVASKLKEYSTGHAHLFEAKQDAIRAAISVEEEKAKLVSAKSHDVANKENLPNPTKPIEHMTGREMAKTVEAKAKVKTRPKESVMKRMARGFASLDVSDSPTPKPATPRNTISVKATTVKFFKHMFSSDDPPERSPKWLDLVDAMVDAGCYASHGGGSAVTFEDEKNKKGSIVLHKPHPDPTVDHVMLKTIGKRLTKWFGWGDGTFVEREKEAA